KDLMKASADSPFVAMKARGPNRAAHGRRRRIASCSPETRALALRKMPTSVPAGISVTGWKTLTQGTSGSWSETRAGSRVDARAYVSRRVADLSRRSQGEASRPGLQLCPMPHAIRTPALRFQARPQKKLLEAPPPTIRAGRSLAKSK